MLDAADLPLGDRLNFLYMNTVVTRGRAELLVTATGMATEMGKLAGMIAARTGVPVMPITLVGTRVLLPGQSLRPHYSTLQVRADEPILAQAEDWQAALQLRDAARRRILVQGEESDAADLG